MTQVSDSRFLKRRSLDEGLALVNAAHAATQQLYCDVLRFWRTCPRRRCKRHRRCTGDARFCLERGMMFVSRADRLRAREAVIAGGPRRLPPASHMEWQVRREDFSSVAAWPG